MENKHVLNDKELQQVNGGMQIAISFMRDILDTSFHLLAAVHMILVHLFHLLPEGRTPLLPLGQNEADWDT